jgi:hypothetical protein
MSTPVAVCAPAPEAPGTEATVLEGVPGFSAAGARARLASGIDGSAVASTGAGVGFGAAEGAAFLAAISFFGFEGFRATGRFGALAGAC